MSSVIVLGDLVTVALAGCEPSLPRLLDCLVPRFGNWLVVCVEVVFTRWRDNAELDGSVTEADVYTLSHHGADLVPYKVLLMPIAFAGRPGVAALASLALLGHWLYSDVGAWSVVQHIATDHALAVLR